MKMAEKVFFNYAYLRGFIRENFKTLAKYADFLGISATTLYERLSGKSPFTQEEIYRTAKYSLGRPLSVDEVTLLFFTREFRKIENNELKEVLPCRK